MSIGTQAAHQRSSELNIDIQSLESNLRAETSCEVRFDSGSRALYATDASNYRQVPIGVVVPRTEHDITAAVAVCNRHGAPIVPRGGGTSLAGQTCNTAIVIDASKYLRDIIQLDPAEKIASVQPGVVLDDLRHAAENYHLTFGPDPSTHEYCTLGGMIGNDSCGVHSVMGGKTVDNIEEMRILTYDGVTMTVGRTSDEELASIIRLGDRRGEIYSQLKSLRDRYAEQIRRRFPSIPRRVSGYNLDQLLPENGFNVARALVGTEGTCAMVLEATVRLIYSPPKRALLVLGYPDAYTAGDHVVEIMDAHPVGLEGIDAGLIQDMKKKHMHPEDLDLIPEGGGWLLVEFGGETKEEVDDRIHQLMDKLKDKRNAPSMRTYDDPEEEARIWEVRESGLGATAWIPNASATWPGWEDSAVPPEKLGPYLRDLRGLLKKYDYGCDLYGHFGQGCVHTRIDFDLQSQQGIEAYRRFAREAAEMVTGYGGSLSGEHGDGQARGELLPIMFGQELVDAFREFKKIWDPDAKMNPGKVVDPYRLDENLRLGTSYNPPNPQTHFSFPDDSGTFKQAALRCVGVGKCRREGSGTMCPSYMVTHEEKHATRGRARLLFEMLHGDVIRGGWREQAVYDALDLCLACKGCKGDCPVNVDMATYKAEFLSHYYEHRLRPRHAYAFGFINYGSRIASVAPWLVNVLTQTPGFRTLAKFVSGIAPQRRIPPFSPEPFKAWFRKHRTTFYADEKEDPGSPENTIILWPDTFNNYFHADTMQAAVEVLETAGCHVRVPRQNLCCGRPLYDFGLLDPAKRLLRQTMDTLRPQIRAGIPIVVLEPSCAAVFRDELINLYPRDEDAQRLSKQTFLLSEFLQERLENYQPPEIHRKAIVHGHCHHRAVMTMRAEEKLLQKLGLDYTLLDSGCCGMAGAFGFEREHYDISVKVGERVLLPAVRRADSGTLIIADGFSCREQISQLTNRKGLHLAEVIQMAIQGNQSTFAAGERAHRQDEVSAVR